MKTPSHRERVQLAPRADKYILKQLGRVVRISADEAQAERDIPAGVLVVQQSKRIDITRLRAPDGIQSRTIDILGRHVCFVRYQRWSRPISGGI